jgi:hypothetical protein
MRCHGGNRSPAHCSGRRAHNDTFGDNPGCPLPESGNGPEREFGGHDPAFRQHLGELLPPHLSMTVMVATTSSGVLVPY